MAHEGAAWQELEALIRRLELLILAFEGMGLDVDPLWEALHTLKEFD